MQSRRAGPSLASMGESLFVDDNQLLLFPLQRDLARSSECMKRKREQVIGVYRGKFAKFTLACRICGGSFTAQRPDASACSSRCRVRLFRRRKAGWDARNRSPWRRPVGCGEIFRKNDMDRLDQLRFEIVPGVAQQGFCRSAHYTGLPANSDHEYHSHWCSVSARLILGRLL